MAAYLIGIALGPVQGFIAAARKTRDLWYGSALLSECSLAVAQRLYEAGAGAHDGGTIFPSPTVFSTDDRPGDDRPGVANRIIAIVETDDPAQLAKDAREKAQGVINRALTTVEERMAGDGVLDDVDVERMRAQVNSLLESYAAWVPYDPADYTGSLQRLEIALAARKSTRNFVQPEGAPLPKSSLDSGRESVLRPRRVAGRLISAPYLRQQYSLSAGEELDGVSLLKRLAETKRFVSVSRVAIQPWLQAVGDEARAELQSRARELVGTELVHRFDANDARLKQFSAFPFDSELFFGISAEDRKALSPQDGAPSPASAAAARFVSTVRNARNAPSGRLPEPTAYVAVLHADGDHMGRTLRQLRSARAHRDFSEALAGFASSAEGIVQECGGSLVYSGGDDVLAFLPVHTAIRCAHQLQQEFREFTGIVLEEARAAGALQGDPLCTLSAGVAIGHYREPLRDLIEWSKRAARVAKDAGRNSLAVALHTRSAGATAKTAVRSWVDDPLQAWDTWVEWHASGELPDGAVYELWKMSREFASLPSAVALPGRFLEDEISRVLRRKRDSEGQPVSNQHIDHLLREVDGATHADSLLRFDRIIQELLIARRIAPIAQLAARASGSRESAA